MVFRCRWMPIFFVCFLSSCGGGGTELRYEDSSSGESFSEVDFLGDASISADHDSFVPEYSPDEIYNDPNSDDSNILPDATPLVEGLATAGLSSALYICGDNAAARYLYPSINRFDFKDYASLGFFYLPQFDDVYAPLDGDYQGFLIGGYFPWSPCWPSLIDLGGGDDLDAADSFSFAGFPDLSGYVFSLMEGDVHEHSSLSSGGGSCAADFNNDGVVDVFWAGGAQGWLERNSLGDLGLALLDYDYFLHSDIPSLLIGQGSGVFHDATEDWQIESMAQIKQVLCHDYDKDGDVDIVVSSGLDVPVFLENEVAGSHGAGFINIRLVGPAANLMSIGARLEVSIGGMGHTRLVAPRRESISYPFSEFHVGLGDSDVIDRIVVIWPDGGVSDISDIKSNQFLDVFHPIYIDHIKDYGEQIRQAKEQATAYLNENFQSLDIDVLVLLDVLDKMSDLNLSFDVEAQVELMRQRYILEDDAMRLRFLDVFEKIYTDKPLSDPRLLDELLLVDKITVPALYCNQLGGLPSDYWSSFADAVDDGGYMATHALLSYFWIQENRCETNLSSADVDHLVLSVADVVMFDDIQAWDLDIEAMAFLLSAKRYDLIKPEWVSHMLSAQRDDGAWSAAAWFPHQPNNHTTLVALWVLHYLENFNRIQTRFLQY